MCCRTLPQVPWTQIRPFLWTYPGFGAWTTADHVIKLIQLVLLMRGLGFALQTVSSWTRTSPSIGMKSYFSFPDFLESMSFTLQPGISQYQFQLENFKAGCRSIRHSQYLRCCQPKHTSCDIYVLPEYQQDLDILCTKTLEGKDYLIPFSFMNDSLPTKCVFLSMTMTLSVMQMN